MALSGLEQLKMRKCDPRTGHSTSTTARDSPKLDDTPAHTPEHSLQQRCTAQNAPTELCVCLVLSKVRKQRKE